MHDHHARNRSSGIIAGAKRAQPRAALNEGGKNAMGKTTSLRLEEEEEGEKKRKEEGEKGSRDERERERKRWKLGK